LTVITDDHGTKTIRTIAPISPFQTKHAMLIVVVVVVSAQAARQVEALSLAIRGRLAALVERLPSLLPKYPPLPNRRYRHRMNGYELDLRIAGQRLVIDQIRAPR